MRVIFFGPPGVGKGTQARMVANAKGWEVLAIGDVLREEVHSKSRRGSLMENYLRAGSLVPDELILDVVEDFIAENRDKGIIFDGFPRNLNQAIALEQVLSRHNEMVNYALGFVLPEEVLLERLSRRVFCPKCHRVYNMASLPPLKEGICDYCGTTLIKREDDQQTVIIERLKVYEVQTKPLVDYYRSLGIYRSVDAQGSVEDVYKRVLAVLNAHNT
ncbi:MAG: adenylate kinase [candidate division WOR-3 bacterium]